MSNSIALISKINDFISTKHDLDNETIEFLINLKKDVLVVDDNKSTKAWEPKKLPQVERLLRSMGKKVFLDCYELFDEDYKTDEKSDTQKLIVKMKELGIHGGENSFRTRVSINRSIFRNKLNLEALKVIASAPNVTTETKLRAEKLLEVYGGNS